MASKIVVDRINEVAITPPATGATITIADGKTLTVTDDATISGTNTGDEVSATTSVEGIVELATNAESLTGTDTSRATTPDDIKYVLDRRNLNMVNLLTNSGFGVWSNGTPENVRALPDATSTVSGTTVSSDAHVLTAGMFVKDAAGTPLVFEVVSVTDANTFEVDRAGGTNGQWYEVTPGCVGADTKAMDGWHKVAQGGLYPDVYREFSTGRIYPIKTIGDGTNGAVIRYGNTTAWVTNPTTIADFAGRTVTFGILAKTSVANKVRISMSDGITSSNSGYHTGSGDYEWLEVTHTFSASTSGVYINMSDTEASGIAYWKKPMLVYGSSIGEGNYQPIPQEWVTLETAVKLLDNVTVSTTDTVTLNSESVTSGKIPKGAKRIKGRFTAKNSAANKYLYMYGSSNGMTLNLHSQTAYTQQTYGEIILDTSGNVYYIAQDTNWSELYFILDAVQVN